MDGEAERTCLMCGAGIPPEEEECLWCVPLESVNPPEAGKHRYASDALGPEIPGLEYGIGVGLSMMILGVAAFIGLWISGLIWPYALILSVIGAGVFLAARARRKTRGLARERLRERRAKRGSTRRRR